ncbi:MAG: hypothetical protein J0I42_09715 [Bosea sp.]|uniref:hypothetical protein n=1 Tax=Bosea sp. (in: a-proteobacteria) TaxID=1871050 RepID=UPI001ACEF153|nr:hypothetical protein [Bosea sp. (in: a-proteobacteria)]MBN9452215.1 hypothetical protein [Bosea sp. (in: a-proteobacteria)]
MSDQKAPAGRVLAVRLSAEQADKVSENAEALGMSVADYLTLAVQERLEREFPRLRVYHPPGTTRQDLVDALDDEVIREEDETDEEYDRRKKLFQSISETALENWNHERG